MAFLQEKAVELGISSDESVEIKSGVESGDQVVTGVTADMVAGMKVTAMPQVDATSDAASTQVRHQQKVRLSPAQRQLPNKPGRDCRN